MTRACRTFGDTDIESLVKLMRQLGYEHSNESLQFNISQVRKQGGEVFVAEDGGHVCGCISAILDVRMAAGVCGEIVSLVVDEAHRGKGLGKQLVNTAENYLKQHTKKIRVRANVTRADAHEFYAALGFCEIKTQKIFRKSVA
ncbi:Mycothiol acetyltransferase [Thalassocella blandensis]|nr:Mycothiol acetyltransferase [Thalassocella blandensis]